MQLRYEVEQVLDSRGSPPELEYLVQWKHFSVEDATWEKARSELLKTEAARGALARFKKASIRKSTPQEHVQLPSGSRKRSVDGTPRCGEPSTAVRWTRQVVRSIEPNERAGASPRILNGGSGELPMIQARPAAQVEVLDREHRYWLVLRQATATGKCTVVPLLAAGRFGGCGRRAGRIRWKPAALKQGYEREVSVNALQVRLKPTDPRSTYIPPFCSSHLA